MIHKIRKPVFAFVLIPAALAFLAGCARAGTNMLITPAGLAMPDKNQMTAGEYEGDGAFGDWHIKIGDDTFGMNSDGERAIIVRLTCTNNAGRAAPFSRVANVKAFQHGEECARTVTADGHGSDEQMLLDVTPGASLEIEAAYTLRDETCPVEIEVSEPVTLAGTRKVITKTFAVA